MDIINLALYKEAKRIAETSKALGDPQDFQGVYAWLLRVKNVQPNIDQLLSAKTKRQKKKL